MNIPATALMVDKYELTMIDAWIKAGQIDKKATFEVFGRKLQPGFRYGVFAGLNRVLSAVQDFTFDPNTIAWLREAHVVSDETLGWLRNYRFTGSIEAYQEGELYFPNSPVLTVRGTLGDVVLETLVLSVLNHDSAIATKAARMVSAANGRPIIEMGSRRTHEHAAIAAARAAHIAGFASTSNLAAGYTYGIPVVGTAAHAFTLSFSTEAEAFAAQIDAQGPGTTLLVDTYDTERGIENAVEAVRAGGWGAPYQNGPGAIRIDSGDLSLEATKAREQLDALGATDTRITVTSDLDEYVMKDLQDAPIDGYGVGTQLVSTPPAGMVYKLVEIEAERIPTGGGEYSRMRPVAKNAHGKKSVGGRKQAFRLTGENSMREVYTTDDTGRVQQEGMHTRALQVEVMKGGKITHWFTMDEMREHHARAKADLPAAERKVWNSNTPFGPYLTAENVTEGAE